MSGCSYHLAGMDTVLSGARERVFLSFGRHGYSAERVRVSGCSYHLAGMDTVLSGVRERVFLPFGRHGYSASGCA